MFTRHDKFAKVKIHHRSQPVPMLKVKPELRKVIEERIERMSSNPNPPAGGGAQLEERVIETMQCEAKINNFIMRGDEPVEGGGDGTAPLPLQNMFAGAGFCAMVWTVKAAALLGAKLDDVQAIPAGRADGQAMYAREDRPALFLGFSLKLMIKSSESDDMIRKVVRKGLMRCPVWNTFKKCAPTEITVMHNGVVLPGTYLA